MGIIPVCNYPLRESYDSAAAAIAGAKAHPLQPKARADSALLAGGSFVDACWTDIEFVIKFSHSPLLRIYANGQEVGWDISNATSPFNEPAMETVGALPVICRWRPDVGDHIMDRSALVSKRRGSEFQRLFVNEGGLLVYCRGQLILMFHAVHRTDLDQPMLFVTEGE